MIAGFFLYTFIGWIINVKTMIFVCGWFGMLGMSMIGELVVDLGCTADNNKDEEIPVLQVDWILPFLNNSI